MEMGAEALGLVLGRVPWQALNEGASRWSRVIGARCTSRNAATSARWIARQASDPVKLKKIISTMDKEERRLLCFVGAGLPISSVSLTSFALRGWGDLRPALERCARIGVLVPRSTEEDEVYGNSFWSFEGEIEDPLLITDAAAPSGLRALCPREGRVIHFDSALVARRTLSALVAAGIPVLDIGEGILLLLEVSGAFRKIIREEGFKLEKSEDLSCFQLPSGPGGGRLSEKSSKSNSKGKRASPSIDGRTMDLLAGRALRKRIEDAISTQSSLVFLLRLSGRKAFQLIEAVPISVFQGPPLMVVLDTGEPDDHQSELVLPLSDIAAVSLLS